jgi:hypothetical protein
LFLPDGGFGSVEGQVWLLAFEADAYLDLGGSVLTDGLQGCAESSLVGDWVALSVPD